MAQVFTIGHSTGTVSELLGQVRPYLTARSYLIDVRSVPYSAHAPQFNADTLSAALCTAGLHYVGMGRELGARRSEPEAYNAAGQVDCVKTMRLPLLAQGIARLQRGLSLSCCLILMCTERTPLRCLRLALIARALTEQGIAVQHIVGTQLLSQTEMERALLTPYQAQIDTLLTPPAAQLEQVYGLLNRESGYRR